MLRFLLPLVLTGIVSAQETMIREVLETSTDTHVEVLALFSKPSPGGYLPVRVKVANNLPGQRSVRLDFEANVDYSNGATAKSQFEITAPKQTTVTRDLLVPLAPVGGAQSNSFVVAATMYSGGSKAENSISSSLSRDQPAVLLSDALFTVNASKLDTEMNTRLSSGSYGGHYGSTEFAGKFDPRQLPDNWLAYSGYDSILMLDSDWSNVHAAGRSAILSWVRLGGQLVIYSNNSTPAALGLPADASSGSIEIAPIPASLELPAAETVERVTTGAPLPYKYRSMMSDFGRGWPLKDAFGEKPFRYLMFIFVLVIFGILVGPINLFVFAKSGRRHRLFITTPLISLGASVVLIGLIIFQDGFGGAGERIVLMEVRPDADQNAHFIVQQQIARTGVLSKSSFTLDTPAHFAPVALEPSRWARFTNDHSGGKGAFDLQPGSGKLGASGDWFRSRSEQGHVITAVVPSRGRIETAGSPERLVSTFDFPIETLFFSAPGGLWYRATDIKTGEPFQLTKVDFSMVDPELAKIKDSLGGRLGEQFVRLRRRPGHFIALTGAAPGIETFPGIRWQKTRTIITGPLVSP